MRLYHKKHGYKFIDGADLDKLLAQGYVNAPYNFEPEVDEEEFIVEVPEHVTVPEVKKGFVDKVIKLVKGGLNA